VANNKTKANRDNPMAAVVAPIMVAVETDSTEVMVAVPGTIKAAE
jgi:hypothetical protein